MSGTNVGNQSVYFNYHKTLTGDMFNQSQYQIRRPGVLTGLEIVKINDTSVTVNAGIFNITDNTRTTTINKASSHTLTVSNANNYVVARYSYTETENWYAEFLNVSSPNSTDVVLAALNWTGSTLTSVDMSVKTDGNRVLDSEIYVTANSYNKYFKDLILDGVFGNTASGNIWLNILNSCWFGDSDTAPIEDMLGGMLPVFGFDKGTQRYIYFYLKSGSSVDINFKFKYVSDTTDTSTFQMKLEYMTLTDGMTNMDSLTFSNSNSETLNTPGVLNRYKEFTTSTLKIPSAAMTVPDKLVLCRLTRDISDGGDASTGTIKLLQIVPVVL